MKKPPTRRQLRNRDLLRECRRLIASSEKTPISATDLAIKIAHGPAPRYYVEFDYGLRVLTQLSRGRTVRWKSDTIRRQWQSLKSDVDKVCRRYNCSLSSALARVLSDFTAPSFFIEPTTIYRVLTSRNP